MHILFHWQIIAGQYWKRITKPLSKYFTFKAPIYKQQAFDQKSSNYFSKIFPGQRNDFERITKDYTKEFQSIIDRAGEVTSHTLNVFGDKMAPGSRINWHTDFKTSYTWKAETAFFHISIPYGLADIKVPWEISRFQFSIVLGQAYALTGDERYARTFADLVDDWILANPFEYGVNWACTMDVAIRATNWALAYEYFRHSPSLTPAFHLQFHQSIHQHGTHIINNLEFYIRLTSNHYLANLAGLLTISVLFPGLPESNHWKNISLQEMNNEMKKQVYSDGCNFEASTCYHRLTLELFFLTTLAAVVTDPEFTKNNHRDICEKIFGKEYTQKLFKMFEAVLFLLKPDGQMPQIGDNDSGHLHIFSQTSILDMRYLLTLGAIFFKENNFKIHEFNFCQDALWIFGFDGLSIWNNLLGTSIRNINSHWFKNSGWAVMRDNKSYCIVSSGPNGQNGQGGHAHNDKLSFEWHTLGENVIIDPGTYHYTANPTERNYFRSTKSHNTVTVDGQEQNRFNNSNDFLFKLRDDAKANVIQMETGKDFDIFRGRHFGYTHLKNPVTHVREIKFYKNNIAKLDITDWFSGKGTHDLEWNLVLSPNLSGTINIISNQLTWVKVPAFYSPEYGVKITTVKWTTKATTKVPCEFKFSIRYFQNKDAL